MTKRIINISYFTMLTIIGGMVKISVSNLSIIPYTLQTIFVIASGLVLGARDGAISQLAYLALGLIGLPIFAHGGGFSYVTEPSFGYLAAFSFGAGLSGLLKGRYRTLSVMKLFFCAECGLALIYLAGMTYQFFNIWLILNEGIGSAWASLTAMPLMFIADSILLYCFCQVYPKLMTLIGLPSEEFDSSKKEQLKPAA